MTVFFQMKSIKRSCKLLYCPCCDTGKGKMKGFYILLNIGIGLLLLDGVVCKDKNCNDASCEDVDLMPRVVKLDRSQRGGPLLLNSAIGRCLSERFVNETEDSEIVTEACEGYSINKEWILVPVTGVRDVYLGEGKLFFVVGRQSKKCLTVSDRHKDYKVGLVASDCEYDDVHPSNVTKEQTWAILQVPVQPPAIRIIAEKSQLCVSSIWVGLKPRRVLWLDDCDEDPSDSSQNWQWIKKRSAKRTKNVRKAPVRNSLDAFNDI